MVRVGRLLLASAACALGPAGSEEVVVAACSAYAACGSLTGDCCPTPGGVQLGCCRVEAWKWQLTPAVAGKEEVQPPADAEEGLPAPVPVPVTGRQPPAEAEAQPKEPTQEEYCAGFTPVDATGVSDWVGEFVDLFSPDDRNPASRRYIDLDDSRLIVSADTGAEQWGRRFDPETDVVPVLEETEELSKRKCSFRTKVPIDAPVHADVEAGALDFTLTLGTALGQTVIMWSGMYDGKGGTFGGEDVPAEECGNFWQMVPTPVPVPVTVTEEL